MKSFLAHKFTWVSCSSCYMGENCRHFKIGFEEDMKEDKKSHVFNHLHSTATYFGWYNFLCFKVIDKANSTFDLRINEALHINWRKLKSTTNPVSSDRVTIASAPPCSFLSLFGFLLLFVLLLHLLFSLSLTLIIGIFYCLNYALLLLHLITKHLLLYLFLSYIVFIVSSLIIIILYCLNYVGLR